MGLQPFLSGLIQNKHPFPNELAYKLELLCAGSLKFLLQLQQREVSVWLFSCNSWFSNDCKWIRPGYGFGNIKSNNCKSQSQRQICPKQPHHWRHWHLKWITFISSLQLCRETLYPGIHVDATWHKPSALNTFAYPLSCMNTPLTQNDNMNTRSRGVTVYVWGAPSMTWGRKICFIP